MEIHGGDNIYKGNGMYANYDSEAARSVDARRSDQITGDAAKSSTNDQLTLSRDALLLREATDGALSDSTVRSDLVQSLKLAINRGEYPMEPRSIAKAMVKEGLL